MEEFLKASESSGIQVKRWHPKRYESSDKQGITRMLYGTLDFEAFKNFANKLIAILGSVATSLYHILVDTSIHAHPHTGSGCCNLWWCRRASVRFSNDDNHPIVTMVMNDWWNDDEDSWIIDGNHWFGQRSQTPNPWCKFLILQRDPCVMRVFAHIGC